MRGWRRLAAMLGACCLAASPGASLAQSSAAAKLVTFVVNFPPGGPSDILARLIATQVGAATGQTVIVDNKPGATGAIGAAAVAKSPADGHTVLFAIDATFTVTPTLQPGLFDAAELAPVMLLATSGLTLAAHPRLGVTSAAGLIERGRRQAITVSSGGNGSPGHLAAAILMEKTGVKVLHVPYRGNTPAVLALVQGEAEAGALATPGLLPHIQAGRLTALAVTGADRSALLPAVPTVGELGLPDLSLEVLYLAFVPAATPRPAVATLAGLLGRAMAQPDVRERLIQLDMKPVMATDGVAAELARLRARYAAIIRATGITAD